MHGRGRGEIDGEGDERRVKKKEKKEKKRGYRYRGFCCKDRGRSRIGDVVHERFKERTDDLSLTFTSDLFERILYSTEQLSHLYIRATLSTQASTLNNL